MTRPAQVKSIVCRRIKVGIDPAGKGNCVGVAAAQGSVVIHRQRGKPARIWGGVTDSRRRGQV